MAIVPYSAEVVSVYLPMVFDPAIDCKIPEIQLDTADWPLTIGQCPLSIFHNAQWIMANG
jgi:hypothetical protein